MRQESVKANHSLDAPPTTLEMGAKKTRYMANCQISNSRCVHKILAGTQGMTEPRCSIVKTSRSCFHLTDTYTIENTDVLT